MLAWLEHLDHRLFFFLNQGFDTWWLDQCMWLVSVLTNGGWLVLATAVGLWLRDRQALKRHLLWMIAALLLGASMVQTIKHVYARPRPLKEFAERVKAGDVQINVVGRPLRYHSFPSGHAQAAASILTYLALLYPQHVLWWYLGIALAALSRVYVGVHFPSDVLTGVLLGSLSAVAVWRLRLLLQRQGVRRRADTGTEV
jgi:undecaprenyl-diphosphatase